MNKINWVIIICVLTSVLFWYWKSDFIIEYLAFSGKNLLKGRVWTLFTSLFLHGNFLHLGGNMIFLFVFGNTLENKLKATKTLTAFFIGGASSFLLSIFFYNLSTPIIGASAAIFTLVVISMLIKPLKFSFLSIMPLELLSILYFLYSITAIYSGVQGNVAYITHLIGFIMGIPFGIAWNKKWARNLLLLAILVVYLFILFILLPSVLDALSAL